MNKINKVILAILTVIACAVPASAGLRFGVKAGVNLNNMSFNKTVFDSENRCGFTGGVMLEYMLPITGLGLDISAMYSRMNTTYEVDETQGTVTTTTEQKTGRNFIEIPLNIKYKLSLPAVSSIIKPMVYTGPALAVQLGDTDSNTNFFSTKRCGIGWNLGVGLELFKHLQVQGGYTFGINNMVNQVTGSQYNDVKGKNNYWTVTAAWLF